SSGGFCFVFFFSSRRRHTRCYRDWSSDVCSSDLVTCLDRRSRRRIRPGRRLWPRAQRARAPGGSSTIAGRSVGYSTPSSRGRAQIGRASCRERVEIGGVGVRQDKKDEEDEE